MEKLEAKTESFEGKVELRCRGWCHKKDLEGYQLNLPSAEYFI